MPHTGSISSCVVGTSAPGHDAASPSPRAAARARPGSRRAISSVDASPDPVPPARARARACVVRHAAVAQVAEHGRRPACATRPADVGRRRRERRARARPRRSAPASRRRRTSAVHVGSRGPIDAVARPPVRGIAVIDARASRAGAPSGASVSAGERSTDHDELRGRQHGFHVHLQRALALARDRDGHDVVALRAVELVGGPRNSRRGVPVSSARQRLAHHGRLGARAAEPAAHRAGRRDQRRRAGLARTTAPAATPPSPARTARLACASAIRRRSEDVRLHAGACLRGLDRLPHLRGRERHVDVPHARRPQRVDHRVHVRGRRAHGGRLADALGADRVVRRRRHGLAELELRRLPRGRASGSP